MRRCGPRCILAGGRVGRCTRCGPLRCPWSFIDPPLACVLPLDAALRPQVHPGRWPSRALPLAPSIRRWRACWPSMRRCGPRCILAGGRVGRTSNPKAFCMSGVCGRRAAPRSERPTGLPAKTLKACRSSLRCLPTPGAFKPEPNSRPHPAFKDFALRAACAFTTW